MNLNRVLKCYVIIVLICIPSIFVFNNSEAIIDPYVVWGQITYLNGTSVSEAEVFFYIDIDNDDEFDILNTTTNKDGKYIFELLNLNEIKDEADYTVIAKKENFIGSIQGTINLKDEKNKSRPGDQHDFVISNKFSNLTFSENAIFFSEKEPTVNNIIIISTIIKNVGEMKARGKIQFYFKDPSYDGILLKEEHFEINPRDNLEKKCDWITKEGTHKIFVVIINFDTMDKIFSNKSITVKSERKKIKPFIEQLKEFFYNPYVSHVIIFIFGLILSPNIKKIKNKIKKKSNKNIVKEKEE